MDISHNRARGADAETLAAQFLQGLGMLILKRNFHFGRIGEIDIIAEDGEILVFVEVKARSNDHYGSPESAITPSKQRSLRRVAEGYLYTKGISNRECRFDVVTIRWKQDAELDIRHIPNAF